MSLSPGTKLITVGAARSFERSPFVASLYINPAVAGLASVRARRRPAAPWFTNFDVCIVAPNRPCADAGTSQTIPIRGLLSIARRLSGEISRYATPAPPDALTLRLVGFRPPSAASTPPVPRARLVVGLHRDFVRARTAARAHLAYFSEITFDRP